ncbi:ubiquinone biosynthesis protein Coq4, partial [Gorgonomyces haynaldii]
LQRLLLASEAAVTALRNPWRGDMIAVLGETTGLGALSNMKNRMMMDVGGRRILRERPVINHTTLDLQKLQSLDKNTFGNHYFRFLEDHGFDPEERSPVKYIQDPDLEYVMLRYRQVHDLWHVLNGLPQVSVQAELAVKVFEYFQTGLPMTLISVVGGPLRLTELERDELFNIYAPWAIQNARNAPFMMNVMYEDLWERDLKVLQKEFGLRPPP